MTSHPNETFTSSLASFGGGTMMGATASIKQGDIVFQRYTLKKVLGVGGMGVVWLAQDTKLDEEVALKFVPEALQHDGDAIHDLKVQTKLGLRLTHSNIVSVRGFEDDGGRLAAISMEYVDGSTLGAMRLEQPGQIFEVDSLQIYLLHILNALEYAHEEAKIVHRDLKPANVMVNSDDRVKVADFGIACSLRNSVTRVMSMPQKAGSGTLHYMSPQQLMGSPATISDDIYSLGATLYELMTGTPPFTSGDISMQIREITPPSMMQRRADNGIEGEPIPSHWEDVVAAALSKEPGLRPASIAEFRRGLQGQPFVRGAASNGSSPAAVERLLTSSLPAPAKPRLSMPVLTGSLAAMLGICGSVWFLSQPTAPAQTEKAKPRLSVARFLHLETAALKFDEGPTSPGSKKVKWNDLIRQLRLADYQDEPKLRELLLRSEGRGEQWSRQEESAKLAYTTEVTALKAAVEKAHTSCEAKDLGAAAKAAVWSDILRKNVPLFISAESTDHTAFLAQARTEAEKWQATAAKEKPARQPTLAELVAKTRVSTWNQENWKSFVKMLQGVLYEKGHPPGKVDGSWTPSTFEALVAWQSAEKLPVTGLLDGTMLQRLGLDSVVEPVVAAKAVSTPSTGSAPRPYSPRPSQPSNNGSMSWGDAAKAKFLQTPIFIRP